MSERLENWARNIQYRAARVHRPASVDDVCAVVRGAAKLRVLGTRHSFNTIADCAEDLISLEKMPAIMVLDRERSRVRVGAGVRYGALGAYLHEAGYAIHNLASLPHISVAGAVATGTHGSGLGNGNLATIVTGLDMVTAEGEVATYSREREGNRFDGMVVALGALGVVTALTLEVVPTFSVRQWVYEALPWVEMESHFEAIMASGYSVSFFTDWRGAEINQVWVKQRMASAEGRSTGAAATFFGARAAPADRHPIGEISAENCTPQMGLAGAWYERLAHFRMGHTPSGGDELQSEYFVPREAAVAALRAVAELRERVSALLLISEIRTIAGDGLWMSPQYRRDSVGIHFTWKPEWAAVRALLPAIESALEPFGVRPHWGKLFTMLPHRVRREYERLDDFRELAGEMDPGGKFRNDFLDAYIFGG